MAGWTNRGKYVILGYAFRGQTVTATYHMGLVTSGSVPAADTNLFGELTQIATGNGYSDGGYSLTPGGTDFDVWTEDDSNDRAFVQIKDIVWTASGGNIPSSGNGARYAALTDYSATIWQRNVIAFFDLSADRTVSSGQTLTLQNCELRLTE